MEVTRTIYTTVVELVVMYVASAWAPATSNVGAKKKLSQVQRGFVQKIVKAYRTPELGPIAQSGEYYRRIAPPGP